MGNEMRKNNTTEIVQNENSWVDDGNKPNENQPLGHEYAI